MTPEQLWDSLVPTALEFETELQKREAKALLAEKELLQMYIQVRHIEPAPCCVDDYGLEKEQHWPAPKRQAKPKYTQKHNIRTSMKSVNRNR